MREELNELDSTCGVSDDEMTITATKKSIAVAAQNKGVLIILAFISFTSAEKKR